MAARRVLVIEDEAAAREALHSLLVEDGFAVRASASGEAGVDDFLKFHPEVVVCDFHLQGINGLQVLRRIRHATNDGKPPVVFIMLSAGLIDAKNERALRSEADAFLGKPIDLRELRRLIGSRMPDGDAGGQETLAGATI